MYTAGNIVIPNNCSLTGTAGAANGGGRGSAISQGVHFDGEVTVDAGGTLTGTGEEAQMSAGVAVYGMSVTVDGSLTATSGIGTSTACGLLLAPQRGTVTVGGSLTATAKHVSSTQQSYGLQASAITLTGQGKLYLKTDSEAPDADHSAKTLRDLAGSNALTTGAGAIWTSQESGGVLSPIASYDDKQAYSYLKVYNAEFSVTPASASVPAGNSVTLTANTTSSGDFQWYQALSANSYAGATEYTAEKGHTYSFSAQEGMRYYFCRFTERGGEVLYSNIVSVMGETRGISLDPSGSRRFSDEIEGYLVPPEINVKVKNNGNVQTPALTLSLTGADASLFVLDKQTLPAINPGNYEVFYVRPVIGCAPGTYRATVTVSAEIPEIADQSLDVSFRVISAAPRVEITFTLDGAPCTGKTVVLSSSAGDYPLTESATPGMYENPAVPLNLRYDILMNGAPTGEITSVVDVTIKAVILSTLSFEPNGGAPAPAEQYLVSSVPATEPVGITNGAYTLEGWFTEPEMTFQWDFANDRVTAKTTLYAKWAGAPAFTAHPQDAAVAPGQPATFAVSVTGAPAPALQWQLSTDGGNTFADIPNATGDSYTIPAAALAMNGYRYRCTATNASGSATSDSALLTVSEAVYPVSLTLTLDGNAYTGQTVSLKAPGAEYALTESGASGIYEDSAVRTGEYTLYVNGASAGETLKIASDTARTLPFFTLSFEPNGGAPAPKPQIALSGKLASEPPQMSKEGTAFAGWYKDADFKEPWDFKADTVNAKTRLYARWESSFVFTAQPVSQTVEEGSAANFVVKTAGADKVSYQWQISKDGGKTFSDIPGEGAKDEAYKPVADMSMNGCLFRCAATSGSLRIVSSAATLTVTSRSPVISVKTPDTFTAKKAQDLTFTVGENLPDVTADNLDTITLIGGKQPVTLKKNAQYDAPKGDTLTITLRKGWINTLSAGNYTVDVLLKGGAYDGIHVYVTFSVIAPVPVTGDSASPALWLALAALSITVIGVAGWRRRRT